MIANFEREGIRWDPSRDMYVFADGTVLPGESVIARMLTLGRRGR